MSIQNEQNKFNLLAFGQANIRTLHFTWFAFFMTFVVWLGLGPMMPFIKESLLLTDQQAKVLLLLNVAITIPARIIVGMLVDKFGPRILFSVILILGGLISIGFAWSDSYESLAIMRFLSGFIGAGFVVGIRMIGEWFPAKQTGLAQGIYGGWGNFGSFGAAATLPFIAASFVDDGWRYAITFASIVAIAYGAFYYMVARNTPQGATYFKPKKTGAMEITSGSDLFLYIIMNIPLYLALALLTWKLSPSGMGLISSNIAIIIYIALMILFAIQAWKIWQVNSHVLINLVARPGGGWISDIFGRKRTLVVVFVGITAGFLTLGLVDKTWPVWLVVGITIFAGIFSKAGSGAVYAMVPLIQRRMTGQIAGMAGAFGNVGAVLFLTVNSIVDYDQFFMFIGIISGIVFFFIAFFLEEPKGQIAETLPDGTVQMIDVK